jgi:chorismate-pyruvate lyase
MEPETLYPLTLFRRAGGLPLPRFEFIEPAEVPEPFHSLLVHRGDMTSRLENFHRGAISLQVLHCEYSPEAYRREVVLLVEPGRVPVEYGAIEIRLVAFAPEVRELIVKGEIPLGGLLNRFEIKYRSEPIAFVRIGPDAVMNGHFQIAGANVFYGRCNVLFNEHDVELARIVELLPP